MATARSIIPFVLLMMACSMNNGSPATMDSAPAAQAVQPTCESVVEHLHAMLRGEGAGAIAAAGAGEGDAADVDEIRRRMDATAERHKAIETARCRELWSGSRRRCLIRSRALAESAACHTLQ